MPRRPGPSHATKTRVFLTWPALYGVIWWLTLLTAANRYDSYEGGPQALFWGLLMLGYGVLFYLLVGLPLLVPHLVSSWLRYLPVATASIYLALSYLWFGGFVLVLCVPLLVALVWEVGFDTRPVRWASGKTTRFWKYCTEPSAPRWKF